MKIRSLKLIAAIGLCFAVPAVAQAEVLVILPQSGSMAAAAESVRDGLQAAYYAGKIQPALRFVDNSQRSIQSILQQNVNDKTELVIGPLARDQVEQLIALKPKVKVLALNQVGKNAHNVWQYALSPDEDARAITRRMQQDGVSQVLVLTQVQQQGATARFHEAMTRLWGDKLVNVPNIPKLLTSDQGVLLLGDNAWVNSLKLPQSKIYTHQLAVEQSPKLPVGIQFCDVPALYKAKWPELLIAYQNKPVSMPYQRLLAFGGDAWEIASNILSGAANAKFSGRTGDISMVQNVIDRQPECMQVTTAGLLFK